MTATRKAALVAGVCFLVTHVTSVAALVLYGPVLNHPGYIVSAGTDTRVLAGGWLEVILALAIVGTAVALFPAVRLRGEGLAIGYVGLRTLEAAIIAVGIVSLLAVVTLRQHGAGAAGTDAASSVAVGQGLVAVHNWTFLLGPNFVCAIDTLVLAYLMWRSRLIPRFIAGLGLVGGPLLFVSATAVLFGAYQQVSLPGAVAPLPVFAWELALAFVLIVKGLRTTPPDQNAMAPHTARASRTVTQRSTGRAFSHTSFHSSRRGSLCAQRSACQRSIASRSCASHSRRLARRSR